MEHQPKMPLSGFVSAAWVKARYSVPNSTLYKAVAEGLSLRVGPRAVRFSVESLRAFEAGLTASIKSDA